MNGFPESSERRSHGFDGPQIQASAPSKSEKSLVNASMNHPVRGRGGAAQRIEIAQRPNAASAPAARDPGAFSSERQSPVTVCPAPINSRTTAEPIYPVAPVTKTCILTSSFMR